MKNKMAKYIVNSLVLAAMAAVGITAYQLGTSPEKKDVLEMPVSVSDEEEQTEQTPMLDAGTSLVKADLEEQADEPADAAPDVTAEAASEAAEQLAESSLQGTEVLSASDLEPLAAPEINFSEDTLMEWPVHGNILVDYSMDQTTYFPTLDQYRLSPAVSVQAVEGAPVTAAVNGTVYAIEETAQTGTTLTMELGNGYQAIYGQLTDLTVQEGDVVEKGTIIGYINAPTKYYSKEGSNLYFAMKKDGEPIDPIVYLP